MQVLLTILLSWALCVLLTSIDVFERGNPARTDIRISVLIDSPWFRFPYPGMQDKSLFITLHLFYMSYLLSYTYAPQYRHLYKNII